MGKKSSNNLVLVNYFNTFEKNIKFNQNQDTKIW